MTNPNDSEDNAGNQDICPHHHKEAEAHEQRHGNDDTEFCLYRHALFLDKAIQVLLIHLRPHKPVVELLGRIRKEKHC